MRPQKIFAIALLLEAMLYLTFYYREIAWYPPSGYDQCTYLVSSYALRESAVNNGLQELLRPFITGGHENTVAFPVEGALFGLFFGGARLSRLLVGFAAFAALQICVYATTSETLGSRAYGVAALGLVLCEAAPWYSNGGLFDYRMDFVAYCLYGIWTCLVLRSGLFYDRKWAVASALVGILLVLNRFLTIIYLSGVLFGFAAVLAVLSIFRGKGGVRELNLKQRFRNLAISLVVLSCGTIPFLVLNAQGIYRYYVVPHLISGEQYVRAREFGVTSLASNLVFYPKSIILDHLGPNFIAAASIGIFGAFLLSFLRRMQNLTVPSRKRPHAGMLDGIYLVGAVAGPLGVLTCDISKSPVVGGIVGVPCALLVIYLMAALSVPSSGADPTVPRSIGICAAAFLALGALSQLAHAATHLPEHYDPQSYSRAAALNRWFVEDAGERQLSNPAISADVMSEWFGATTITASAFEQTGRFMPFRQLLGRAFAGVDRDIALSQLAKSDYVILTTMPKTGLYPFYGKIRKYWDDLKSWTDENMLLVRRMPFEDYMVSIYARPMPKMFGLSGGWITSGGLYLQADRSAIERFPVIELTGATNFDWLPRVPNVSVTAQTNKDHAELPATLTRDGNNYTISFDTSSLKTLPAEDVGFHVRFDVFFIPQRIGLNNDSRELVIRAPLRTEMRPKQR